jgi:hypothetical protein
MIYEKCEAEIKGTTYFYTINIDEDDYSFDIYDCERVEGEEHIDCDVPTELYDYFTEKFLVTYDTDEYGNAYYHAIDISHPDTLIFS